MRTLNTHVHVYDDQGAVHVFGPGDEVPAWAGKKITNPDVWDGAGASSSPRKEVEEDPGGGPPPMSGSGSGRDAWATYAARHDVQVPGDAKRDDIVQALDAAGVPTAADPKE